jgi:hypothetical protein
MKFASSKVFIRPSESAMQLCRNFDLDKDLDGYRLVMLLQLKKKKRLQQGLVGDSI